MFTSIFTYLRQRIIMTSIKCYYQLMVNIIISIIHCKESSMYNVIF